MSDHGGNLSGCKRHRYHESRPIFKDEEAESFALSPDAKLPFQMLVSR